MGGGQEGVSGWGTGGSEWAGDRREGVGGGGGRSE